MLLPASHPHCGSPAAPGRQREGAVSAGRQGREQAHRAGTHAETRSHRTMDAGALRPVRLGCGGDACAWGCHLLSSVQRCPGPCGGHRAGGDWPAGGSHSCPPSACPHAQPPLTWKLLPSHGPQSQHQSGQLGLQVSMRVPSVGPPPGPWWEGSRSSYPHALKP